MKPISYRIALRVWHPDLDPLALAERLHLNPTMTWAAGAPRRTRGGADIGGSRAESFFTAALPLRSPTLAEILTDAVALLRPFRDELLAVIEKGRAELFVGMFFERSAGEVLPATLLADLADLGIDLALDLYSEPTEPTG